MDTIDFQHATVFPALQLKSAVKIAAIAAKVANDAYNISVAAIDEREFATRPRAKCDSPDDRAGDGNGKVDSYGSDL